MDPETGDVLDFVGRPRPIWRAASCAPSAIRTTRFREDHLRLLRAVRFAARLGFEIEPATFAAIRRDHALILKVSAERVRDELVRILTEGGARRGFELLDAAGLLADHPARSGGHERRRAAARIPSRRRRLGAHAAAAGAAARSPRPRWRWARCCTMSASRHLPGGRAHPLRRPRGGRRAAGARHSDPAALLARGDRAGGGADRQSHEVQGREPDEGEHPEALSAPARISTSIWNCTGWT